MDIDFVVTWVDGSDKNWREKKSKYSLEDLCDDRENRYYDWDLFKYWFRGVEKFTPWVRKVFLVTDQQVPSWLNLDNTKLQVVDHTEYINKDYLPTFNSSVIEDYLHNIKGLSKNFVYFNDDLFVVKSMSQEDFFKNGKPCDMVAFQPIIANPTNNVMSYLYLNDTLILANHFDKRKCVKNNPRLFFNLKYPIKYLVYNFLEMMFPQFTGMYSVHGPAPYLKSTFEEVWEKEGEALAKASKSKFRSSTDINQYLFREWQKLSGNVYPRNVHRYLGYYEIADNNDLLCEAIRKQRKKIVCINDCNEIKDKNSVKRELQDAFESIFPNKSSFEI